MRRDNDWLEEPEPIGYEITEEDGWFTAYPIKVYPSGETIPSALIIASGRSKMRVAHHAAKYVHAQHRTWQDRVDPSKSERVIMYQKPPKVGPKGPSGGSRPNRSQR